MIKKGFTLAEVVVTLGVVGVVTAITAPSLINLMPDKNKVQVLKVYKLINDANIEFLNDPGFYTSNGTCLGFDCEEPPLRPLPGLTEEEQAAIEGDLKYGRLLCHKMHTDGCTVGTDTVSFTTPDGIVWTVDKNRVVKVELPAKSGQTTYEFNVDARGKITGKDKLTEQYLKTRDKLNNKKEDYAAAEVKLN